MIDFLARYFYKLMIRGQQSLLQKQIDLLNRSGHAFSADAHYDRSIQIHAANGSSILIASGSQILNDTWLIAHEGNTLSLGKNVFVSQHCTLSGNVSIGANTMIAGFVTIIDANHVFDQTDIPINRQGGESKPIAIGEDVWIGAQSVVLQGVEIGNHCIVGANSTVTENLPPWSVAVGTPAKIVRVRDH